MQASKYFTAVLGLLNVKDALYKLSGSRLCRG